MNLPSADPLWLRSQILGLLLMAALLLIGFETTGLDLGVEQLFFDAASGTFPLRHHWLFEQFLHNGLKTAMVVASVPALALCALGGSGRISWLPPRAALITALGLILIPAVTTLLKQLTHRHCPWDLLEFGGYAPWRGLLQMSSPETTPGACFPAGHASAGMAWIIWAVSLRETRPVWARRALWASLALGGLMGVAQMLRGAHFLSHTLWSAWLAWGISITLAALLSQRPSRHAPA